MTTKTALRIVVFVISARAFAAQPNQWHGLLLDQSSPDQAIQILGKPTQDDSGAFQAVTRKYRSQAYSAFKFASLPTAKNLPIRLMLFDGAEGFKKVVLIFRKEKLAMICLEPEKTNKINAADLAEEYGVLFKPIFAERDFDAMWIMWDQYKQEARPREYPVVYNLIGTSPDGLSGIFADVSNVPSFAKILARLADEKNPGKVFRLVLLSPKALAIPKKPHNSTLQ